MSRRGFFQWWVGVITAVFSLLLGIPLVGFLASPLLKREPEQWMRVATLDEIGSAEPTLFRVTFVLTNTPRPFEDVRGVFAIRKGEEIYAFTNVCTHMSCSVRWLDWRQQILCPCHGGLYDRWGNLVGGPPPHSLPMYVTKIEDNSLFVANRFVVPGQDPRARAPGY